MAWYNAWRKRAVEERANIENPGVPISSANIMDYLGWNTSSSSGINVTEETALTVPAVWAAVNFISSTIAALPVSVYRKTSGGRERVSDSDTVQTLLSKSPNPQWTSYRWRKYSMSRTLLGGRQYSYIERTNRGRIAAIWPMRPSHTVVIKQGVEFVYEVREADGTKRQYQAAEVLDLPYMIEEDMVTHVAPIGRLRSTIANSIAMQQYGERYFANGGVPPLSMEGPFTSGAAIERASKDMSRAVQNASKEGNSVLPLPMGHELKQVGYNPEQGQMIESRRLGIEEVARIYQLPPVFLQDLTHGTYSNTEQQDLQLVKHTLTQWVELIEQEWNMKLLPGSRTRYIEFNMDGLLRGDFKTRMEGYARGVQNAIYTPNEVRARENLPAEDGGENLVIQQNMFPLGDLDSLNDQEAAAAEENAETQRAIRDYYTSQTNAN